MFVSLACEFNRFANFPMGNNVKNIDLNMMCKCNELEWCFETFTI